MNANLSSPCHCAIFYNLPRCVSEFLPSLFASALFDKVKVPDPVVIGAQTRNAERFAMLKP